MARLSRLTPLEELGFNQWGEREILPHNVNDQIPDTSYYISDLGLEGDKLENLSVSKLLAGSLRVSEYIQSTGFVSGTSGWRISGDGSIEAKDLTLTGGSISYGKTSFTDSTNAGYYISSDGMYFGSAADAKYLKYNISTGALTIYGSTITNPTLTGLQAGSEISIQGWQFSGTFSATDYRVVAWTSGTITLLDGTTYSISAGNTGNMAALTYIYLNIAVSVTVLQTTTTAATAVGTGKILICVAKNNTDTTSYASFQAFGGSGGQQLFVDNISANSASTNEFVANTANIKDAIITNAKVTSLEVSKLTAGTISSKAITLAVTPDGGDTYIAAGKTDFTTTTAGFILGMDDSDSDRPKFYIGDATDYLYWDGVNFILNGYSVNDVVEKSQLITSNQVIIGSKDDGILEGKSGVTITITRYFLNTLIVANGSANIWGMLATDGIGYDLDSSATIQFDDGDFEFSVAAETDGTSAQDVFMGIYKDAAQPNNDATTTDRHFGFYIQDATLYASNANGSTQTKTDISSGITLTNKNSYRCVYDQGTDIKFYVNDVLKATHTTNLPGAGNAAGMTIYYNTSDGVGSFVFSNNYVVRFDPT